MKTYIHKLFNLIGFKLQLVSPEEIISWATRKFQDTLLLGEISEPLTLNFVKGYIEPNGLFCEKIFGPISSWKCMCYKEFPINFENISKENLYFCKFCGLELNDKKIRRYRMGFILLNTPIAHSWYLKNTFPFILNNSVEKIEQLIYYKSILSEINITKRFNNDISIFPYLFSSYFLYKSLKRINLITEFIQVQEQLLIEKSIFYRKFLIKRAKLLHLFFTSNIKPHWLFLDVLPVIPPGLRPFLQLPNNTFIMSPLNLMYKKIITINNRLGSWVRMKQIIPIIFEIIEKQNLQYSIDALFQSKTKDSIENKSLIQNLKGKFGRFRQNILGKRVDFSGRSVIIPGQDLLLNEIGIPSLMAIELYLPLLVNILKHNSKLKTLLKTSFILQYSPISLKPILIKILSTEVVLLNRAPTLHKMSIQAMTPRLVENYALKLYPIACSKFNADFDGDQMGVFIVSSYSSKKEAKSLLSFDKNIFSPSCGHNLHKPTLGAVLGIHSFLNFKNILNSKICLNNVDDVFSTYTHGLIKIQDCIWLKTSKISLSCLYKKQKSYVYTSVGKVLIQMQLNIFK